MAQVSRAGYYRHLGKVAPGEEDMAVREAIQKIALEHRGRYGYRRITAQLRRQGLMVNHKRVERLMREDNLLAIRRRKFVITTDSRHELKVYVNLAARMELTGLNQRWVADITLYPVATRVRVLGRGSRQRRVVDGEIRLDRNNRKRPLRRPVPWRRMSRRR